MSIPSSLKHIDTSSGIPSISVVTLTSFLPIPCVKPSFGTQSSRTILWFSQCSCLSKNPFHLAMILSRSFKTIHCSSFIRLFLAKALACAIPDIFLSPSGVSSSSYNLFHSLPAPWLCYCFLCRRVCLHVAISAFLPSWCFPLLHCPFLSLYHLLHIVIIPPLSLIISWGTPPSCNAQHPLSYSQNRRSPLLPPFLHTLHWFFFLQHRLPKFYFRKCIFP